MVLPQEVKNPRLLELFTRLTTFSDAKRMGKEEFEGLELGGTEVGGDNCNSSVVSMKDIVMKGSSTEDSSSGNRFVSSRNETSNRGSRSASKEGSKLLWNERSNRNSKQFPPVQNEEPQKKNPIVMSH